MSARGWFWAAAIVLASAGCDETKALETEVAPWPDDGRWWEGGSGGTGGEGVGGKMGSGPEGGPPADLNGEVRRILTEHCAPCHSGRGGVAYGGFGDIYDAEAMAAAGLLVPGDADASWLYRRVAAGEMPPAAAVDPFDPARTIGPVTAEDRDALAAWIDRQAPSLGSGIRTPYTGVGLRRLMADDVATLPEGERPFYRYVSLAAAHGSIRLSVRELDAIANAVSAALNALSPLRGQAVRPVPLLDPAGEVVALRIDLRDYELDASDWARLEAATEIVDRNAFPCTVPFLRFDHILSLALSDEHVRADGGVESVYANIVLRRFLERAGVLAPGQLVFEPAAPAEGGPFAPLVSAVTLPQLAAALGVDLAADTAQGGAAAVRLCTALSNVVGTVRCLQRDAMPGGPGRGFWWSMSVDQTSADVFQTPVGPSNGDLVPAQAGVERFTATGGAALWPWPNASMGVAVFDDQLRLRSSVPAYASYQFGPDVGFSGCFYCHGTGPFVGGYEPLSRYLDGDPDPAERAFVERLFAPKEVVDAYLALDLAAFAEGARTRCVRGCGSAEFAVGSVSGVATFAGNGMFVEDVAQHLFLDVDTLLALLDSDPDLASVADAIEQTGALPQDEFERSYGALRRAAVAAGVDEAALNFCAVPAE